MKISNRLRKFRNISKRFNQSEAISHFWAELLLFAVISAASATAFFDVTVSFR